jgi:hypothetical protein
MLRNPGSLMAYGVHQGGNCRAFAKPLMAVRVLTLTRDQVLSAVKAVRSMPLMVGKSL